MTDNLYSLRGKILEKKRKEHSLKSLFGHRKAVHIRSYFDKWQKKTNEKATVEEVNDEGPIVEEVLHEKMRLANLTHFLQD